MLDRLPLLRKRHPVIREWLSLACVLMLLSFLLPGLQLFWRLDQTLYDEATRLSHRPMAEDIIVVAIDEDSLQQIGRWPWRRAIHATLLGRLRDAGAKAVFLDVILTEQASPDQAAGDLALANALAIHGRTVLPVHFEALVGQGVRRATVPTEILRAAAYRLGHIDAPLDPDGVLRRVPLAAGIGEPDFPHAMLALLEAAGERLTPSPRRAVVTSSHTQPIVFEDSLLLPFTRARVNQVSYASVLAGTVPDAALRGKLVLVGATASGLSDAYSTPLSGEAMRAMPGILLHAQLLNGLRGGVTLRALGNAGIGIAAATLTLLLLAVFLRLTPRQGLVLTFVLAVAWLATAVAVFRVWGLWIAPIYGVFLVLLAYPLWSWRRLEATQRYMAEEVHRLAEESDLLPAETALAALPNTALPAVDLIDARIREVRVAADRLRNLKRLLTDSLEQLPEAALVVDGAGVIALANDRAALYLAGHAAATPLAGQPLVSLLQTQLANPPGDDWQGWLAPAVQSGETLACEARSESGRDLLLRVGPIYTARAHLVGVIVTMIDITPLREAERKRDEVLRVMTHDMRSPQASILTLIEMHQVDAEAMPAATVLERTARYARRTLALADGFLKLSKAEQLSGKALPAIDLVDAINDAIDTVWPQATARRIRIARAMSLEHAILRGDHDLLTRAFSNLLGNAVKYSPDETVISVGLLDEGDYFVATVSDQGFGIPREDLPRLFSRFTRIERSNPTQADGVGLGLVMVKSFIEAHGGNVSVDSETGGAARGTVFTIRLPARHQMA